MVFKKSHFIRNHPKPPNNYKAYPKGVGFLGIVHFTTLGPQKGLGFKPSCVQLKLLAALCQ